MPPINICFGCGFAILDQVPFLLYQRLYWSFQIPRGITTIVLLLLEHHILQGYPGVGIYWLHNVNIYSMRSGTFLRT